MKNRIIKIIKEYGPITQKEILERLEHKITARELRKYIHKIRAEKIEPIIATNRGLKITYDVEKLRKFNNRIRSHALTELKTSEHISYFIRQAQYRQKEKQLRLEV